MVDKAVLRYRAEAAAAPGFNEDLDLAEVADAPGRGKERSNKKHERVTTKSEEELQAMKGPRNNGESGSFHLPRPHSRCHAPRAQQSRRVQVGLMLLKGHSIC